MARTILWTWDPDRSDGGVIIDSVDINTPEINPDKTVRLGLDFWHDGQAPGVTGGTAGGTTGFTAGGTTGSTVSGYAGITDHVDRYKEVRRYCEHAGRYGVTDPSLSGVVHYKDRTPASAPIDSVIVALEPDSDLEAMPGLWIAIDSYEDRTRYLQDRARLGVRATVLSKRSDYATRSDLKAAIG